MTTADRLAARAALEDASSELLAAGEGIDAIRDVVLYDSGSLRAASAAVRDARANVSLALDGLRFA
jgi:hypothetical protein